MEQRIGAGTHGNEEVRRRVCQIVQNPKFRFSETMETLQKSSWLNFKCNLHETYHVLFCLISEFFSNSNARFVWLKLIRGLQLVLLCETEIVTLSAKSLLQNPMNSDAHSFQRRQWTRIEWPRTMEGVRFSLIPCSLPAARHRATIRKTEQASFWHELIGTLQEDHVTREHIIAMGKVRKVKRSWRGGEQKELPSCCSDKYSKRDSPRCRCRCSWRRGPHWKPMDGRRTSGASRNLKHYTISREDHG